jgi:hypothetical protein
MNICHGYGRKLGRIACSAIAIFATATVANADCAGGYWCTGLIQAMTMTDDAVYIRLAGDTTGLTSCTPYSQNYFTLPRSNVNYSAYYATLLGAYLAKETVLLRPIQNSTNCSISYIQVP